VYSSFVHGGSIETAQAGCVMQEDDFQKVQFGCLSFDSELAPLSVESILSPSISMFFNEFPRFFFCRPFRHFVQILRTFCSVLPLQLTGTADGGSNDI